MERIADKISIVATDEGSTDTGRDGEWRNLRLELHNRSDKTVFLFGFKTAPISPYLRTRNKDGICYDIEVKGRRWGDAQMGLSGTSAERLSVSPNTSLAFVAPIPVNEKVQGKEIRGVLTLYPHEKAANGRRFFSNGVVLP